MDKALLEAVKGSEIELIVMMALTYDLLHFI